MATLPNLIEAIARCDGRDRSTLDQYARVIREAGHVQTGKRGRGAANMAAYDASNLMLGMNGADTPSGAPLAVSRFRSLRTYSVDIAETFDLEVFHKIKETKTFGEALETLVEGFGSVIVATMILINTGFQDQKIRQLNMTKILERNWDSPFHMEVRLHRYYAEIVFRSWVGKGAVSEGRFDAGWRTEFYADFIQDTDLLMKDGDHYGQGSFQAARKVTVAINARMLLEVWTTLYGEEPSQQ